MESRLGTWLVGNCSAVVDGPVFPFRCCGKQSWFFEMFRISGYISLYGCVAVVTNGLPSPMSDFGRVTQRL